MGLALTLKAYPGTIRCDGRTRIRKVVDGYRADKLLTPTHQVGAILPTLEEAETWLTT